MLEFRSGAVGVPGISSAMARRLATLTGHKAVSPREARRRLGSRLDAAVARCKGRTSCVAAIGRRLGCSEVILVGISQLGDVILAIQRIDSKNGRVLTRLADSREAGRPADNDDVDRYLRRLLPAGDFLRYGHVSVKTGVAGDEVFLDGEFRGTTPLAPIQLAAPGRFKVVVRRPGHEEFAASLDVLPDATVAVEPKLSARSAPQRWYQQWWVWALVGGAVAAGATTAAVLATRQGADRVPVVVQLP